MANNAWDRTIISVRERPLSSDLNGGWSAADRAVRDLLQAQYARRTNGSTPFASDGSTPCSGFIADGFKVVPQSPVAMGINVTAGMGFQYTLIDSVVDIGGALNCNDLSSYKPLLLTTNQSIATAAADPTNPRIDIVEVSYDRRATDNGSRDVLDVGTGEFVATLVDKTLAWVQDGRTSIGGAAKINYKVGTPNAVPVAPSVTSGYMKIAEIRVEAASVTVPQNKIVDTRLLLAPGGVHEISGRMTLRGTGTGASPPTIQSFLGPPGSGMAAGILAGVGSKYALYFWCGGAMQDAVFTCHAEGANPILLNSTLTPLVLGAGDLAVINGANGLVSGPAPAVGQASQWCEVFSYQKDNPVGLEPGDTKLHFTLKFRSY